MTDSKTRTASCLCGGLRVAARGEPADVYICACRDCRKKSASAFSYAAIFAASDVTVAGAHHRFRRDGDSGRWIENNFCRRAIRKSGHRFCADRAQM
jgi:hypothetical protein